jgi:hypothetical protein
MQILNFSQKQFFRFRFVALFRMGQHSETTLEVNDLYVKSKGTHFSQKSKYILLNKRYNIIYHLERYVTSKIPIFSKNRSRSFNTE